MKTHWILTGIAVAGLGFAFIANSLEAASDPFAERSGPPPEPKLAQVQVEFVEMSHEALTKLLFLAKPSNTDATKLREQVQEMVSKNEAKVLETQLAVAKSGQKATAESIHEFIYPTEFEPANCLADHDKKPDPPEFPQASFPFNPATPTAFDTRNVGSTLEIEPTIDEENRTIDVRVIPELIWHTGNTTWHEGRDKAGNPYRIQMPDFNAVRLNTNVTCITGQYTLAGVLSPKNDKGEVDMTRKLTVFVKCDVLAVK